MGEETKMDKGNKPGPVTVYMPPKIKEELMVIAKRYGWSLGQIIMKLIYEGAAAGAEWEAKTGNYKSRLTELYELMGREGVVEWPGLGSEVLREMKTKAKLDHLRELVDAKIDFGEDELKEQDA